MIDQARYHKRLARNVWLMLVSIEPKEKATGTVMMRLIERAITKAVAQERRRILRGLDALEKPHSHEQA